MLGRVNGDRRAFGELNAKEKTHMELLKAYYHDPKSVEKVCSSLNGACGAHATLSQLAGTIGQMQQAKQQAKQQGAAQSQRVRCLSM